MPDKLKCFSTTDSTMLTGRQRQLIDRGGADEQASARSQSVPHSNINIIDTVVYSTISCIPQNKVCLQLCRQ